MNIDMKRIIEWLKTSHRGMHLLMGVVIGLLPVGWWNTEVLACGVAGAMEFKDHQWGGRPDWVDFTLTVAGVNLGHLVMVLIGFG